MSRKVEIIIAGDASSLERSLGRAHKATSGFASKFAGVGKTIAGVAGGVIGANIAGQAVDFLQSSVKAAMEDQRAQAVLAKTLKNTTGARKADIAGVEDWITKQEFATGILDDELRPALGSIVRATHDTSKAQNLLKVAMDASTATGKPLSAISLALAKAYNGSTGALGKLGIKTKDASGHALTFSQIMKNLRSTVGGATAAATETTAGKMKILQTRFTEAKESLGNALLPILTKLADYVVSTVIPAIEKLVHWFQEHKAVAVAVAAGLGLLIAPFATVVIALIYAWTHFEKFREIVLNVINAVHVAIQDFVGAVQAFWRRFGDTILQYATSTWNNIKVYISGVLNIIHGVIKTVTALIHGDWGQAWNGIKQIFVGVWQVMRGIVGQAITTIKAILMAGWAAIGNGIKSAWSGIVGWFRQLPGNIVNALSGVGSTFLNIGRDWISSLWDGIKGAWNSLADRTSFDLPKFHIYGTDKDIGGGHVNLLPHLAQGAIVKKTRGGIAAVLGEGGFDEAVVPLPHGARSLAATGTDGPTVHVHVTAFDVRGVEAAVTDLMTRLYRQNGNRMPWERA